MPRYEYKCEKCKKIKKVTQKISDKPLTKCEKCNGPLRKLISLSSFNLKGGGWYEQGYQKDLKRPGVNTGAHANNKKGGKKNEKKKTKT